MLIKDHSSPAFSIGKGSRYYIERKDKDLKMVGPGSYERTFANKQREPSFTMGAKLGSTLVKRDLSPDPTHYTPSISYSKLKPPICRIGTAKRMAGYDEKKAKLIPAPGSYEVKS